MTETTIETAAETVAAPSPKPRLKTRYADEIKPALLAEFGFDNVMQVPAVVKVIVNMVSARPRAMRSSSTAPCVTCPRSPARSRS